MILTSFLRALAQIGDRRFQSVLWRSIGLTIVLLIAVYTGLLWLVDSLTRTPLILPWVGEVTWLDDLLGWGSLLFVLVLSFFVMVPVTSAFTSLFLDEIAAAVEARHYPHLPPATDVSFIDTLRDTVGFLAVLVAANIAAFALYLMVPFAALFIFFGLNGYLLGREYFQMAATRRIGRAAAKDMARLHRGRIWTAGCLMALPLAVPFVNLFVPLLGAATFTHVFHRINRG